MVEDFPLSPWYLLPDLTNSNCRHSQSPFVKKKINKKNEKVEGRKKWGGWKKERS